MTNKLLLISILSFGLIGSTPSIADPAAQLRDRTSNQYMIELEGILKESGGGIIRKDNSIKWKPVTSGQPSWGNINNNSPTWDWVN